MIIKIDEQPMLNPKDAKVISITEVRSRYRFDKCQHLRVQVDAELAEVECRDCGAKLNAIAVLVRYATEESRLSMRIDAMKAEREKLEKRVRCKCDHCGKMTRV
jgi:septation ring formation regulator EzrA